MIENSTLLFEIEKANNTSNKPLSQHPKDKACYAHKISRFLRQTYILLLKNKWFFFRNLKITFFIAISPILCILLILFLQYASDQIIDHLLNVPNNVEHQNIIPLCVPQNDCLTIGYAVIGQVEPWIDQIMEDVAIQNNMKFGSDIKMVSQGSLQDFTNYIKNHENKTTIYTVFCTDKWKVSSTFSNQSVIIPCQFEEYDDHKLIFYSIFYNMSLTYINPYFKSVDSIHPKDLYSIRLKKSIDSAIINLFKDFTITNTTDWTKIIPKKDLNNNVTINLYSDNFPKRKNRFVVAFNVLNIGSFYFMIPYTIFFLLTVIDLLDEKEKKLKQIMIIMGLSPLAYWFSWILFTIIIEIYLSLMLIICSYIVGWEMFWNIPWTVFFSVFFFFGFTMNCFAFFLSAVCPNIKAGYTVAYTFLLLCFVINGVVSVPNMTGVFYSNSITSTYLKFARWILEFYPGFNFAKIWNDIAQQANGHYDIFSGKFEEGRSSSWSILLAGVQNTSQLGISYNIPGIGYSLLKMIKTILFFIALTWYFDNVGENNRGAAKPYFFFLTKEFWKSLILFFCPNEKFDVEYKSTPFIAEYNQDESVSQEKENIERLWTLGKIKKGLKILGISKTFHKYPLVSSNKDLKALQDVYLNANDGELISILGHNGAGKTTLLNILTGQLKFDNGIASIYGLFVGHQDNRLRKLVGFCPQFDVLWNELTLREHLRIFATIRDVDPKKINQEIEEKLQYIKMIDKQNIRVKRFSGGMRRRVSIAIASLGNPKIIFFDEPTTGLDPVTKDQILLLIKNLKKDKVLVLTTHSMEEAETLSDKIVVIAEGKIRALGSSIYLKNKFGDGYRISMSCSYDDINEVKNLVQSIAPHCSIIDERGGSIIIGISVNFKEELTKLLYHLEGKNESGLKKMVHNWGISLSTLEEVFMKITRSVSQQTLVMKRILLVFKISLLIIDAEIERLQNKIEMQLNFSIFGVQLY